MNMKLIFLAFVFVCFVLGIFTPSKFNLVSAGLAFLTASMIF